MTLKNKIVILFFSILSYNFSFGQNNALYRELIAEANTLYQNKDYEASIKKFERAFQIHEEITADLYNGACTFALFGDKEKAIELLKKSMNKGWSKVDHLQKDSDLYTLHTSKDWVEIINQAKKNKKNEVTKLDLVHNIVSLIESNEVEMIWNLGSKQFLSKTTKNAFSSKINAIYDLLRANTIKNIKELRSGQSTSTNWVNGVKKELFDVSYFVNPKYFRDFSETLLVNSPRENTIRVEVEKINNKWQLSDVELGANYATFNTQVNNYFEKVLTNEDSTFTRYGKIKNDHVLSINKVYVNNEKINNAIRDIGNLRSLSQSDIQKKENNVTSDTSDIFFLSLAYTAKDDDVTLKKKYTVTNKLELMFFDNTSNIVLISNGRTYGFFEVDSLKGIKNFVLNNIEFFKE